MVGSEEYYINKFNSDNYRSDVLKKSLLLWFYTFYSVLKLKIFVHSKLLHFFGGINTGFFVFGNAFFEEVSLSFK